MVNTSIFYDMDKLTNVSTPEGLMVATNSYTGGILGLLMLLAIFIVAYISMKSYLAPKAALGAFTITTLFSLVFMGIGIVPLEVPITLIVATISLMFYVRNTG